MDIADAVIEEGALKVNIAGSVIEEGALKGGYSWCSYWVGAFKRWI